MVTRTRILRPEDRLAWDAWAARHGSFMQSWAWSEFKVLEGYTVLRLALFDEVGLQGGAMAYGYVSPLEGHLWAIPGGPLIDWKNENALTAIVSAVREAPEAKNAVLVRVEPLLEELPACLASTVRAPSDLVPEQTLEVPLGPDYQMLAQMKPKGRYNIRLAERHGIEVELSSDPADIHEIYFVLEQTARYQDFPLEPKSFFVNLAQALLPQNGRIALARSHGMTLAAAFLIQFGDCLTYLYGGHLPIFANRMANYALHWQAMREAWRMGLKRCDLYGFVPEDQPEHPYFGFSRFKEKLGGTPKRRVGSRDIFFYDRLADVALGVLGGKR